ncbi:BN159_2729 family protein [Streptomyces sp. MBT97]|uniref:BN159_2729 family protein n=1 Tax=Streptomyces sp. MBT97 TaxID=2800411 RepID=UPI00190D054D|nr:BN159_2729 family protein [Streptomyces sp. MBT97]MBK3631613.1 BN159_2729 family protein [Streptomyces sp. MBT97]
MNQNLPHAIRVIRTALTSGTGGDPAAAIAHALETARLLADPERAGLVLHRNPAGGWAREHQEHEQQPEETPLEAQARAWDATCERARQLAADIKARLGEHPAFQNVQADRDAVLVSLHITDQAHWPEWRSWFGITHDREVPQPYMVAGEGYRDGIRVSVLAYHLPQARELAREIAQQPYEHEGTVYDLARPQRDPRGDVWFYQGERTPAGMPLLSLDGRQERCTLANIVRQVGPLTPVTDPSSSQATPVMTGGETA